MKSAIITGITGQDGAYLTRLLLEKGYKVVGLIRSHYGSNLNRLKYLGLLDRVELVECDQSDLSQVLNIISTHKPNEVYNLAAQSSVSLSFQQPIGTINFNIQSVLNMLEAIRLLNPSIRFYQASTSEMFGKVNDLPITEDSIVHPLSPYAISKVTAHYVCINYRESYNLYTSCGILFNHESYLRGENFFVKKVIKGAIDIVHGKREVLEVGNLDIKRDFGWSEKYVEAMWLLLQQDKPDDYIISSGKSITLREIVYYVFDKMKIDKGRIKINSAFFRPTEIQDIYGSNKKARSVLNWQYDMDFFDVLNLIIEEEYKNYGK
ncbi:GDP-mannose 4,6-dehydratase [Niastella caeni]|uniref:GDP-mannose 4,6-dehydratase n=1 Tax=Niastella caeni TaxID=2569763 RepID=A0A4S8I2G0_9BACT|nr:GDP-mannose 4,6-dehydratase [Niastella caeni]THU41509.1 GDP-mannose 4,6-dehydratase [Niastella caeni]